MIEENSWWEETRYMLQSAVSYTSIAKVQLMNHTSIAKVQLMNHQRIVNVWHMFNKNKTR